MRSGIWYGIDPAPTGGHMVRVEIFGGSVQSVTRVSDIDYDANKVVIEDPAGVLFSRTNTILWSLTCRTAGEFFGLHSEIAMYLKPSEARKWLAHKAGQPQAPSKDSEVKECLSILFLEGCFQRGLQCKRANTEKHNANCPLCHGTGWRREPGLLHELSSPHLRDAFVVACAAADGAYSQPYHGITVKEF